MKSKQRSFVVLRIAAFLLFFSTVVLGGQNKYYRNANRELVLKNDSIISENIQLKETLEKEASINFSNK